MKNPLSEFTKLRDTLVKRQQLLQEELSAINAALGIPQPVLESSRASESLKAPVKRGPRKRAKNSMSLAEAVLTVTNAKPLTKPEILAAVEKLGYVFAAKSPLNSLNTLLYTNKKIKNQDGKFGPK